jgi:aminopeptidase N
VFSVRLSDPAAVQQRAGVKSELLFFALEDAAGRENLLRALRHLMKAYYGRRWGADDLRSALEQESGKDLGLLFRQWLVEPGIPDGFRSRY